MKRRRRPWVRALGRFALSLGCLFASLLAAMQVSFYLCAQRLPQELAAARTAGIPTEIADIRRLTHADPSQNAAPFYRIASAQYLRASGYLPPKFTEALNYSYSVKEPERSRLLRRGMPVLDKMFETLAKGAKRPRLDWERRWELGYDLRTPEYSQIRNPWRALSERARLRCEDGDLRGALRDVSTLSTLATHLWQEPTFQAEAVGHSVRRAVITQFERILNSPKLTPSLLRRAKNIAQELSDYPDPVQALGTELVRIRTVLHDPAQREKLEMWPCCCCCGPTPPPQPPRDPMWWAVRNKACREAWEVKAIHYAVLYQKALKLSGLTYELQIAATEKVGQRLFADATVENKLNTVLFPYLGGTERNRCQTLAAKRVLLQVIALLEVRMRTGRLPGDLPLQGDAALDPFGGRPLGYRGDGHEFKVYSIDTDLHDDAGLTKEDMPDSHHWRSGYDLAITIR